ncbi:hypothetical protein BXZ70DRAFT_911574 [Cristinia sonorae]|uniref:Uncharacterized protein n=1 Tax=Cristinia sonorae TaxID=1940300 RepID=A0A8K0UCZ4_9AGAR|nr:hypothetical protein BXZ70DRAFT_911574 [Cristinia sonorae]
MAAGRLCFALLCSDLLHPLVLADPHLAHEDPRTHMKTPARTHAHTHTRTHARTHEDYSHLSLPIAPLRYISLTPRFPFSQMVVVPILARYLDTTPPRTHTKTTHTHRTLHEDLQTLPRGQGGCGRTWAWFWAWASVFSTSSACLGFLVTSWCYRGGLGLGLGLGLNLGSLFSSSSVPSGNSSTLIDVGPSLQPIIRGGWTELRRTGVGGMHASLANSFEWSPQPQHVLQVRTTTSSYQRVYAPSFRDTIFPFRRLLDYIVVIGSIV